MVANNESLCPLDTIRGQNEGDHSVGVGTNLWNAAYETGCAVGRESKLVLGSLTGATSESLNQMTGLQMAESFGVGLCLGTLQRGAALSRLIAQSAGAVMGLQFINGALKADRWRAVSGAMADAWRSGDNMDSNMSIMKNSFGRFAVDSTFMLGAGILGGRLGQFGHNALRGLHPSPPNNVFATAETPIDAARSFAHYDLRSAETANVGATDAHINDPYWDSVAIIGRTAPVQPKHLLSQINGFFSSSGPSSVVGSRRQYSTEHGIDVTEHHDPKGTHVIHIETPRGLTVDMVNETGGWSFKGRGSMRSFALDSSIDLHVTRRRFNPPTHPQLGLPRYTFNGGSKDPLSLGLLTDVLKEVRQTRQN